MLDFGMEDLNAKQAEAGKIRKVIMTLTHLFSQCSLYS